MAKKKRESILNSIVEGIQEKKGEKISIVDLTGIEDTVCRYFVICEGGTPNQAMAMYDSIRETVRVKENRKPDFTEGTKFAHWIAMDYGDVMVHIFVPELRKFYDLEHLWADASLEEIPDIL
ncbi:MAG: ribosome silencing factor [Bacteroidaceae bacterium]|nr:ribosome silencing factor [Bacteroidaceae bacterium]